MRELTFEQLLELFNVCTIEYEKDVSDEVYRRYGIRLVQNNRTWFQRNEFYIGIVCGAMLSFVYKILIQFI
jgi:hypothetical protein